MSGKKPEQKTEGEQPQDQVRLKPILGIRPGVYLAWLYGIALLVILFFILLYPGIKNPGAVVSVKSEPSGAAVSVDGVYMEAAPCDIFVPRGSRRVRLSLPGFTPKETEVNVGGRIFASALFPLRMSISETLEAPNPAEAFTNEAAEYAAWTFTGEPGEIYQIPQSLSEGVYRFGPAAGDERVRQSMNETIAASARFADTRAALRDLVRAKSLLDNQGLSPSPVSLLASAEEAIVFLAENPGAALWLGALLTGEAQSAVAGSAWYGEAAAGSPPEAETPQSPRTVNSAQLPPVIRAGGLAFRRIDGGVPLLGDNFPPGTVVETFYICDTLISPSAWEAFLEQRPEWEKRNTAALVKEGLVREEYLEVPVLSGVPAGGVPGISWHAAAAFCGWLGTSLPSQFASWESRLPTEAEWEYAAKTTELNSGDYWEWCNDAFAPLSFLSAPPAAAASLGSPERALRGGSWVNPSGTVRNETRASLPPSACSPFVSFRPVIALKGQQP